MPLRTGAWATGWWLVSAVTGSHLTKASWLLVSGWGPAQLTCALVRQVPHFAFLARRERTVQLEEIDAPAKLSREAEKTGMGSERGLPGLITVYLMEKQWWHLPVWFFQILNVSTVVGQWFGAALAGGDETLSWGSLGATVSCAWVHPCITTQPAPPRFTHLTDRRQFKSPFLPESLVWAILTSMCLNWLSVWPPSLYWKILVSECCAWGMTDRQKTELWKWVTFSCGEPGFWPSSWKQQGISELTNRGELHDLIYLKKKKKVIGTSVITQSQSFNEDEMKSRRNI